MPPSSRTASPKIAVDLRGASPHRALLRQYGDIDIVLDPFPYSGGLTTCEALWMGVPTVTFPGETFCVAPFLQPSVAMSAWRIGWQHDLAGYQALAVRKAADIAALAKLRAGLRAQVKASPLCDSTRFGASLGDGLRHAWQSWCREQDGRGRQPRIA